MRYRERALYIVCGATGSPDDGYTEEQQFFYTTSYDLAVLKLQSLFDDIANAGVLIPDWISDTKFHAYDTKDGYIDGSTIRYIYRIDTRQTLYEEV